MIHILGSGRDRNLRSQRANQIPGHKRDEKGRQVLKSICCAKYENTELRLRETDDGDQVVKYLSIGKNYQLEVIEIL